MDEDSDHSAAGRPSRASPPPGSPTAERLAALYHVAVALAGAQDVEAVARAAVASAMETTGAAGCAFYVRDGASDVAAWCHGEGVPAEVVPRVARVAFEAPGPLGEVMRTGEAAWIGTRAEGERRYPGAVDALLPGRNAWAALPLPVGDRVLGVLAMGFREERGFDEEERRFLGAVARQAAQALGRASAHDEARAALAEARRLSERLASLQAVTAAFSSSLLPEQVGRALIDEMLPAVGADAGSLVVPDGDHVEVLAAGGYPEETARAWRRFPLDAEVPLADCLRTGLPALAPDAATIERRWPSLAPRPPEAHRALAAVPVEVGGRVIGAVGLSFRAEHDFPDEEVAFLLALGRQCGQALERARLFDAERRARAEADAASRAKDEFLALLGHELRNPLAPITAALALLKAQPDAGAARAHEVIERQLRHVVRLVDDLLDVSRIARGKVELHRAPVELGAVVARAVEMTAALMDQRRHALVVDAPAAGVAVLGDADRLAQVASNLLTNAARYTPPEGRVEVTAAREGAEAVLRVRDNGTGIDAELLPRVFDVFYQGGRAHLSGEGGLGLGLALVRNLVELHGGRVEARSEGAGRGAEFTIRLPLLEGVTPEPAAPPPPGPRPPAPSRRVLVVDDNVDAADLLVEFARLAGHRAEAAYDADEALRVAARFAPDVAVLDIGLPQVDGYELARRLRAVPGCEAVRLVALTGFGQARDFARSAAQGFERHLVKPVDIDVLLAAIGAEPAGP